MAGGLAWGLSYHAKSRFQQKMRRVMNSHIRAAFCKLKAREESKVLTKVFSLLPSSKKFLLTCSCPDVYTSEGGGFLFMCLCSCHNCLLQMMPGQDRDRFCSVLLSLHHGEEAGCGRAERRVGERWQTDADLRGMTKDQAEGTKL